MLEVHEVKQQIEQQKIVPMKVDDLLPYANNSNTHSDHQVRQIARSILEFGFTNPVLVDNEGTIIAGHGRIMAAKKAKLDTVPTINLGHLSADQRRAYVIADNQLARLSSWDRSMLASEVMELKGMDYDTDLLGFDDKELDNLIDLGDDIDPGNQARSPGTKKAYNLNSANDEVDLLMGFKTAISRSEISAPMRVFQEKGLLTGSVLDFGAGMDKHEFPKYDPFYDYNPDVLKDTYDTITCNYVLNVQAHPGARLNTMLAIRALLKKGGTAIFSVMTSQDNSGNEQMVRSKKGFQVYLMPAAWEVELGMIFKTVKSIKGPVVAWECKA